MINTAFAFMYNHGFWLRSADGVKLAKWLLVFLQCYDSCAKIALSEATPRFSIMPKIHMLMHSILPLFDQASKGRWVISPLAYSVQVQEDFIGRPSRLSRRTSPRSMHLNVVNRMLLMVQRALEDGERDHRGVRWSM